MPVRRLTRSGPERAHGQRGHVGTVDERPGIELGGLATGGVIQRNEETSPGRLAHLARAIEHDDRCVGQGLLDPGRRCSPKGWHGRIVMPDRPNPTADSSTCRRGSGRGPVPYQPPARRRAPRAPRGPLPLPRTNRAEHRHGDTSLAPTVGAP